MRRNRLLDIVFVMLIYASTAFAVRVNQVAYIRYPAPTPSLLVVFLLSRFAFLTGTRWMACWVTFAGMLTVFILVAVVSFHFFPPTPIIDKDATTTSLFFFVIWGGGRFPRLGSPSPFPRPHRIVNKTVDVRTHATYTLVNIDRADVLLPSCPLRPSVGDRNVNLVLYLFISFECVSLTFSLVKR